MFDKSSILNYAKNFIGDKNTKKFSNEFDNAVNLVNNVVNPLDALRKRGITTEQIKRFQSVSKNPMARKIISKFMNLDEFDKGVDYVLNNYNNNSSPQTAQDEELSKIQNLLKNAK